MDGGHLARERVGARGREVAERGDGETLVGEAQEVPRYPAQLPPCETTRRPRSVPTFSPTAYAGFGPDVAGEPSFSVVAVVIVSMMSRPPTVAAS